MAKLGLTFRQDRNPLGNGNVSKQLEGVYLVSVRMVDENRSSHTV